jgi:hypothetical protein
MAGIRASPRKYRLSDEKRTGDSEQKQQGLSLLKAHVVISREALKKP